MHSALIFVHLNRFKSAHGEDTTFDMEFNFCFSGPQSLIAEMTKITLIAHNHRSGDGTLQCYIFN